VDDFYLLYLQTHMDNTFVLITSISTEYRSAIFTNSDAQAEIAKRVTEEVQAKHFTPKGKSPLPLFPKLLHRLFCYIPNRDSYPAAVRYRQLTHPRSGLYPCVTVLTYLSSPQAKRLSQRSSQPASGGTLKTTTSSTSSRILPDTNALPTASIGKHIHSAGKSYYTVVL
jgi:hypothetical protein